MSGRGRGGRGGRGRGGRGGAPPSLSKQMLMRSAQECGLNERNLKSLQDITRPELFPDILWHEGGSSDKKNGGKPGQNPTPRAASTVYLVNKGREILHRFQNSCHMIPESQKQLDVTRYNGGKKRPSNQADLEVLDRMGKKLAQDERYIPPDLYPTKHFDNLNQDSMLSSPTKQKQGGKNLDSLAIQERLKRGTGEEEEEEGGNLSDAPPPDEEEEEVADYTIDYYASSEESDGGDGGEATF